MGTEFEARPYGGKTFRPRPETHLDAESGLLLIATPWGPRATARKALERMLDYITSAKQDREATTPFGNLPDLSPAANALRNAAMHANESILRDENKDQYSSGVELFAASFSDYELAWAQVGAPQPLLARPGRKRLLPLGPHVDLSFDLSQTGKKPLPALPSQLLGLDALPNLFLGGFRARPGDRVILLSCSSPPDEFYASPADGATLDSLSRTLASADPEQAFWLGILALDDRKLSVEP
jgi:hypothetical protein